MTSDLQASILINNYDYGRFVGQAIESALQQAGPSHEVIVVDDGSTDDSRDVIASFGERIRAVFKENGGQASAFNAGYRLAGGRYVLFLDADDRFLPGKVARVVEVFERTPAAGWLFHRLEKRDAATGDVVAMSRETGSGVRDYRTAMRLGRARFHSPSTSGLTFRHELLARILPMPERDGVAVSDNYLKDVAISLAPGVFLDEVLTTVLLHGENASSKKLANPRTQAHKTILTALHVRRRYDHLHLFADRMFAKGLQIYRRSGAADDDIDRLVGAYLEGRSAAARVALDWTARVVPFRAIR